MGKNFFWSAAVILLSGQSAWGEMPIAVGPAAGPLAQYVRSADDAYAWTIRRQGDYGAGKFAELTLTSQKWHEQTWRHQVFLYKPAEVRDPSRALLFIGGGKWTDELAAQPTADVQLPREAAILTTLADQLGLPVAVLLQVPHQPIFGDMYEDAAVSHTFKQFYLTGDVTWPLLLPMVKSAVRAMDCVAEFGKQEWNLSPAKFTLTGASKRGWTSWLTAAVDPRVECLAPMVIDMLNMPEHLKLQLESWGNYSDELHDYTDLGIQYLIATPAGKKLVEIVDPYSYRERFRQPKLLLLGTNDRYWPLEALNLYWPELAGEKYICYVPNNAHGLKDLPRVLGGISALHRSAAGQLTMPKLSWEFVDRPDGVELVVKSDRKPLEVSVWQATSLDRDFRVSVWKSTATTELEGTYRFMLPTPKVGCAALFGEAKFADDVMPFYLSTQIKIVGKSAKSKPR